MRDWLTIELVLAVLLVTSFTCVGLLALWAATSPRHWFVRTATVLAALSPLLLVPAYEPFLVFILQCAVVAGGAITSRWWAARHVLHEERPRNDLSVRQTARLRFSLATALLLMALSAVAVPIFIGLPQLNLLAWRSVALMGTICGLATLVAGWMAASHHKIIAWPIGLFFCLGFGAILSCLDWFVPAIVKQSGWPPAGAVLSDLLGTPVRVPPVWMWLPTVPLITLLLIVLTLLWSTALRPRLQRLARATNLLLVVLLAVFPLFVLGRMLHPMPIPSSQLPDPNGYDDLIVAGEIINRSSQILNTSVEPSSTDELAAEIARFSDVYDRIRLGLSRPCVFPLRDVLANAPIEPLCFLNDIQALRGCARGLMREAELAQQQGRYRDAALVSLKNMRLGQAAARGGLVTHHLVGLAIEGVGQWTLYPAIAHLDAQTCHDTIKALEQLEKQREPFDQIFHRERIYSEHGFGWYGRVWLVLHQITKELDRSRRLIEEASQREQTIARLLLAELGIRRYRLQMRKLPESLEVLVPAFLRALPVDPYDSTHDRLRYKLTEDGYLLYSVGYDGRDDGGRPPAKDEFGNTDWFGDGDLRLDVYFESHDERTDKADDADAGEADATASDQRIKSHPVAFPCAANYRRPATSVVG